MKNQRRTKKEDAPVALKRRKQVEFEINPYYEQLLVMREQKPAAYRVMSAATLLAVDAYVKAKDAASARHLTKAA